MAAVKPAGPPPTHNDLALLRHRVSWEQGHLKCDLGHSGQSSAHWTADLGRERSLLTSPPIAEFCRRIGSCGAVDLACGASRRRTPRRRSPGTPPVREEPAPPEPLRLRPARQFSAHRTRRLTTAPDRRFLQVSGSVPRTTRTERAIRSIVPLTPSRSSTHEKEGETLSVHEVEADPLGSGRLGS